jgi:cobalamin biosynthetic protein CobC
MRGETSAARREHGGDLATALERHGGNLDDWIDLSTGINRVPYPVGTLSAQAWRSLPGSAARQRLVAAARHAYDTDWALLPVAGAQAAIQCLPALAPAGPVRILSPTYNEFDAVLRGQGRAVESVDDPEHLAGAGLAVVVNPNNPDGRQLAPAALQSLAAQVGLLVVDESFADAHRDLSLLATPCPDNLVVLRSFGKFYGLAGLRLGFALGAPRWIELLDALAGPWPVAGPALEIGARALADDDWRTRTCQRLQAEGATLDMLAERAGWSCVGGTALFRLYRTSDAADAQARLADGHIWSRTFPYAAHWLRLGLPGTRAEWQRLETALASIGAAP